MLRRKRDFKATIWTIVVLLGGMAVLALPVSAAPEATTIGQPLPTTPPEDAPKPQSSNPPIVDTYNRAANPSDVISALALPPGTPSLTSSLRIRIPISPTPIPCRMGSRRLE